MYTQPGLAIFSAVRALLMALELRWGRHCSDEDACTQIPSASASETPPHPLRSVAGHVSVVVVEELVERCVVGLDLSLRRATEKAV